MKKLLLFLIAANSWGAGCAGANGYSFCQTLVVDHTKVAGTLSNYPAAICFGVGMGANCLTNFKQLATATNGGFLQNSSGFDFIFTSDSGGTTPYTYETSIHNLVTGDTEIWIKIPTTSASVDLTVYMFYGNASVTTDQSNATAVWDSDFLAVHHLQLQGGPGVHYTPSVGATDSTGANPLATNQSPISFEIDAIVGVIGGAADYGNMGLGCGRCGFVNQGPFTNFPSTGSPAPFTLEAWFNPNINGVIGGGEAYCFGGNSNPNGDRWAILWDGTNWFIEGDGAQVAVTGGTGNGWHKVVAILPMGQTTYLGAKAYIDGVAQTVTNSTNGGATVAPQYTNPHSYGSGLICGFDSSFFSYQAAVDEMRLSKIERSSDWVVTDYNNQSNVKAFWSNSIPGTSTGAGRTIIIN